MKAYHRLKLFLVLFFAGYLLLGIWAELFRYKEEIFPVSSWALFADVPNEFREYVVRLLAVDGSGLGDPLEFSDAHRWFPRAGSLEARHTVQALGVALVHGDAKRAAVARRRFEHVHLEGAAGVRYELVERVFDPLERWETGAFRSARRLAVFVSGAR